MKNQQSSAKAIEDLMEVPGMEEKVEEGIRQMWGVYLATTGRVGTPVELFKDGGLCGFALGAKMGASISDELTKERFARLHLIISLQFCSSLVLGVLLILGRTG